MHPPCITCAYIFQRGCARKRVVEGRHLSGFSPGKDFFSLLEMKVVAEGGKGKERREGGRIAVKSNDWDLKALEKEAGVSKLGTEYITFLYIFKSTKYLNIKQHFWDGVDGKQAAECENSEGSCGNLFLIQGAGLLWHCSRSSWDWTPLSVNLFLRDSTTSRNKETKQSLGFHFALL